MGCAFRADLPYGMNNVAKQFNRLSIAWLVLVILTCLSWESGKGLLFVNNINFGSVLIMMIAFLKVRIIFREFMEVNHAHVVLRIITDIWIVVTCATIIGIFLLGTPL